jgi:hypothetical protein
MNGVLILMIFTEISSYPNEFLELYIRLSKHVINSAILSNEQFGFRSNSSTGNATFKLLNYILQALKIKEFVGGIFCDLELTALIMIY